MTKTKTKRYTIDPAAFTDGQWEELYNASTIPQTTKAGWAFEARRNAKPFTLSAKQVALAIEAVDKRITEVTELYDDDEWVEDLEGALEVLRGLEGK